MNKDIINGKWKEIKGKLKQQWGELTDDEISKMQYTAPLGLRFKFMCFNYKDAAPTELIKNLYKIKKRLIQNLFQPRSGRHLCNNLLTKRHQPQRGGILPFL